MTAKGEALNDSMLSQQLTWWCLDLAIWHHVLSRPRRARWRRRGPSRCGRRSETNIGRVPP
jgi:hypothetical protein